MRDYKEQKGNTYNMKFKTSEERKTLCNQWCEHLKQGFTRECFPYCDPQTFRRYVKDFPEDFDTQAIFSAEKFQIMEWEKKLHNIANTGTGNASAAIFGLKNIAGWRDKHEVTQDIKADVKQEIKVSGADKLAGILDDMKPSDASEDKEKE